MAVNTGLGQLVAVVATGRDGSVYIGDDSGRVRKVDAGGNITAVAGGGTIGPSDGAVATAVDFSTIGGLAVDATGGLYIWSRSFHRVFKVGLNGVVSTVAGIGDFGFTGDNGPAKSARLNFPNGIALDAAGNLNIADSRNYRIRRVTPAGTITTIAGNGSAEGRFRTVI